MTAKKNIFLTQAGTQICRSFKVHNLIMCKSKVQVVVALVLIWLNKQKVDILFLQETYSTKDIENVWRSQWKGSIFFAHGSNHSCGVLVLVKDHLEFEVKSVLTDNNMVRTGLEYSLIYC